MNLLTQAKLDNARTLNPYWAKGALALKRKLPEWGEPYSERFALDVALYQHQKGLLVDGVFGPLTQGAFYGTKPGAADYLIINGEHRPVDFDVLSWNEPGGLSFYDHPKTWQPRKAEVNLVVLHWDVCDGATDCYDVLLKRGLSVQFILDSNGVVYQLLDPACSAAYHAPPTNQRSVGIEISNPVLPARAGARPVVKEHKANNGIDWQHADFTAEQKAILPKFVAALCDAFKVQRRYIKARDYSPNKAKDCVCGHYHVWKDKCDPGLTLWPVLSQAGFAGF